VLVPDDFFDKEVEMNKQFAEFTAAVLIKEGSQGLEHLTYMKVTIWFLHDCINFASNFRFLFYKDIFDHFFSFQTT
jgi:hypothetical protein